MQRAVEYAKWDPSNQENQLVFAEIRLNLPCAEDYDHTKPRVTKVDSQGRIVGNCCMFCNEGRTIGQNEMQCSMCQQRIVSQIQCMGIQDAARKRRPGSQQDRAWAGTIAFTGKGVPRKFVSQECREKFYYHVDRMIKATEEDQPLVTYSFIWPHMRLLYAWANTWRGDRDEFGWKHTKPSKPRAWDTQHEWDAKYEKVKCPDTQGRR
jgi:hypothetical protein